MGKRRLWLPQNVLEAARERISFIFDEFENVQVSISGGKDSTVLFYLALQEARLRGRTIEAFFLDQEAEYAATIDTVREQMTMDNVIPKWYQVPVYMTNSTSYSEYFLHAWGEGEEWMREKDPLAIHELEPGAPRRFYEIFPYLEKKDPSTAYLVGLRADEGIMRYRAVTKNPGYADLYWSTETDGTYKFYPIYDWGWNDLWKFVYDYTIPYNNIYDKMFWANYSVYNKMRVSNLIHEKSYKCLTDLPKFEPETYDALCRRIGGISTAARYASEKLMFSNKVLPAHYNSWKEFRDFLHDALPDEEHKARFANRFANQPEDEEIYQKQVGQLLINDWENSKPVDLSRERRKERFKDKWWNLL